MDCSRAECQTLAFCQRDECRWRTGQTACHDEMVDSYTSEGRREVMRSQTDRSKESSFPGDSFLRSITGEL